MIDVKQDLQLRYDTFINREQRLGFFKGLAEYLDYVFLEPILKSTFEAQIARRDSLYKKIDEIESLTLQ